VSSSPPTPSRARGYLDSAAARGARVAVSALTLTEVLPGVLLTSDPDDMGRLAEESGRPKPERVAVIRV